MSHTHVSSFNQKQKAQNKYKKNCHISIFCHHSCSFFYIFSAIKSLQKEHHHKHSSLWFSDVTQKNWNFFFGNHNKMFLNQRSKPNKLKRLFDTHMGCGGVHKLFISNVEILTFLANFLKPNILNWKPSEKIKFRCVKP